MRVPRRFRAHVEVMAGEPMDGATATADALEARVRALRGFPLGLSSSQIRERVRVGKTIDHLVPPAVAETIRNSRLYL